MTELNYFQIEGGYDRSQNRYSIWGLEYVLLQK